ncbi:hypothetical protein SAMN04488100_10551 [Alkalibacterium putridalgicola]|uniref:Uncharacterized protein n=2 Tax=Alkalibacterium putridalgicola TaxID=426703 RepID=A0A1H7RMJ6_9LACT|nr:hypothetical protein [Alkalibacterium putridalgicola]SEL61540.1 hypothetical protein SAMN04488100_10551 [Alkalibacterium putridalgicola]
MMIGIVKNEVRYVLINHAFEDWKRIMSNGLTAKQAREDIERDYKLMEREKIVLRNMILEDLETKVG